MLLYETPHYPISYRGVGACDVLTMQIIYCYNNMWSIKVCVPVGILRCFTQTDAYQIPSSMVVMPYFCVYLTRMFVCNILIFTFGNEVLIITLV